jgi:hypothetical protein
MDGDQAGYRPAQGCDDLYVTVLGGRPETRQAILDAGASAFVSKVNGHVGRYSVRCSKTGKKG